jgi:hypothetical protein
MQNNWSTIISKIMNFPIFILKLAPPINEAILPPIMHAIEACKHLMNHLFALIWNCCFMSPWINYLKYVGWKFATTIYTKCLSHSIMVLFIN